MKVYVLETGVYEGRCVHGVYATPEAAMAAWQPKPYGPTTFIQPPRVVREVTTGVTTVTPETAVTRFTYTWERKDWGWDFDATDEHAAEITEYEVMDSGPVFTTRVTVDCIGTCGHKIIKGCEAISAPHGLFCSPDCADNGGAA